MMPRRLNVRKNRIEISGRLVRRLPRDFTLVTVIDQSPGINAHIPQTNPVINVNTRCVVARTDSEINRFI